jgi:YesN/AraC family two-component response regulator
MIKILVVEDEPLIANDIKSILDQEGYHTLIDCFTVELAMEMMDLHHPELVLLDINLKGKKNGLDFAQFLSNSTKTPYIFITSYTDKNTLTQVSHLTPSGFISKPFKPQDIISTVYLVASKLEKNVEMDSPYFPFQLRKVLDFIEANVKEKLTLEQLSAMTPWETEYFGKIFKQYVGMSPYQYLLKAKIEHAKKLIAESNDAIQAICFDLGFSNYGNFYNSFKKFTGMSPDNYRKLISNSKK